MLDPVALTRELVAIRTVNPPGNEQPCAEFIAGLLAPAGFQVSLQTIGPQRATLVARLPGQSVRPTLCFTGHLDTVLPGETPWSRDPFAGEVVGDRLYGRGSTDMKGGVAAMVWAALELAREGGTRTTGDLLLILTADEEVGCAGARRLMADFATLGNENLDHVGAIVVGEPTANMPCLGHKGALWLEMETRGVAAHGSMPDRGVNAILKAARAILALEQYRFPIPPHPLLGSPTLNVGTIVGGQRINIVPDHAVVGVDLRSIPGLDHDLLLNSIQDHLGSDVTLRIVTSTPGIMTDPDHPWVARVFDIMATLHGTRPGMGTAPYVTDASILTPALGSPPTLILGPGEPDLAHKVDEYCHVSKIRQAARAYLEIARLGC
ncbi:MAG: M20 family metallopeptidase [Magnetococcus sp. DMHC-1]|nr:M20 family metallopeptidase [Magnetococcales bacterium]MBF0154085.1 M20 family metallopeptidase [Magnetococcales bacterium]